MSAAASFLALSAALAITAQTQADPHAGHGVPPPATGTAQPDRHAGHGAATPPDADPHAGHRAATQPHTDPHAGHRAASPPVADPHAGHAMPGANPPSQAHDPHAGHAMGTAAPAASAPPPRVPTDHAADALFDHARMATARAVLRHENGGMPYARFGFDLAEVKLHEGHNGYGWEGEASFGGDINRAALSFEGGGSFGGALDHAEFQAVWWRAIAPYWNLRAGVRHDIRPEPSRSYAVLGLEGVAPYWIEMAGAVFLSDKGDVHLRVEAEYDQRITQRLILQPSVEVNFAAQDVPELHIGSGLSDIEAGLRLRYELSRKFAPYVGVEWESAVGRTARFARRAGDEPSSTQVVAGVRFWF